MRRKINLFIKRAIDIFVSFSGLVLLSPLMLALALAVRLTSKGPAVFKQERLGKNGRVFKIYKYRTMVQNAENIGDGIAVKGETDSRITKIGRLLRASSLDELPQLFNIFVGQMSFVGPRPPVTYHPYKGYEGYSERTRHRFDMRPGLTGLVQSTVRNSAPWDERIEIDLEYVERFSVLFDIKILIDTVFGVVRKKSIYAEPASAENKEEKEEQKV